MGQKMKLKKMILFNYCYFRMYKAYEAKNDSPFFRSVIYVSILQLFTFAIIYLYTKEVLLRTDSIKELDFEKPIYVWLIAALILIGNFIYYSRISFAEFENKFENRFTLNRRVKLWMLIVLPFIFLFGCIVAYVYLFGGVILGNSIEGVF